MIASLKAEVRKIYTVRSTYGILLFCLVLMGIFGFWAEGIKAGDSTRGAMDPLKLANLVTEAIAFLSFFGSLVGILLFTNELRYNTIIYTLTASKSRTKILLAKIGAVSLFSVFFAVFVSALVIGLMMLGLTIKGYSLGPQTLPSDLIWRVLFMSWGYGMWGLLLATLIRHQVGALAAFFAIPMFIEPLISLLLKNNAVYLPYNAITQVANSGGFEKALSHSKAALVFLLYLAIGWVIAWYLFLRRDAN